MRGGPRKRNMSNILSSLLCSLFFRQSDPFEPVLVPFE